MIVGNPIMSVTESRLAKAFDKAGLRVDYEEGTEVSWLFVSSMATDPSTTNTVVVRISDHPYRDPSGLSPAQQYASRESYRPDFTTRSQAKRHKRKAKTLQFWQQQARAVAGTMRKLGVIVPSEWQEDKILERVQKLQSGAAAKQAAAQKRYNGWFALARVIYAEGRLPRIAELVEKFQCCTSEARRLRRAVIESRKQE